MTSLEFFNVREAADTNFDYLPLKPININSIKVLGLEPFNRSSVFDLVNEENCPTTYLCLQ